MPSTSTIPSISSTEIASPGSLRWCGRLLALLVGGATHLDVALALAGEGAQLGGSGAGFCSDMTMVRQESTSK